MDTQTAIIIGVVALFLLILVVGTLKNALANGSHHSF